MSGVKGISGAGSVEQIISLRQQIIDRSQLLQQLHQAKGAEGAAGAAPAEPAGGGRGIVGMRERVSAFGGELRAGRRPDGGFRVWARLPLREAT